MNNLILTLDIDWAPDFMIDFVMERLVAKEVKATWFVTHSSPAVDRLRQWPDLFELGIHPNFLPNSTQGRTWEDVLAFCMDLVPEARSMRAHDLFQSTSLLDTVIHTTPIMTDLSLFLPYVSLISPFEYYWNKRSLLRLPYYWEDDFEMVQPDVHWDFPTRYGNGQGVRVFNFHPVHVFLNSPDMNNYRQYQQQGMKPGPEASRVDADEFVFPEVGTGTMFDQVVDRLAEIGNSQRACDIDLLWRKNKNGECNER